MKHSLFSYKVAVVCILAAVLYSLPIKAQINKHRAKVHLNAGYGTIFHGIQDSKVPGGFEVGAGIGYEFNRERFLLSAGAEFMFLNSKTNLIDYVEHKDFLYQASSIDGSYYEEVPMEYHYNFPQYTEKHKVGYLNIPIMVGMTFADRYYAMIGAKIGFNMIAEYTLESTIKTTATDLTLIEDLEEISNHYLTTMDFNDKGKLSLGLNVAPTIEVGVILDEWLNKRFLQLGNNRKTPVSYRAAITADYSVLNINTFSTNRGLFTDPGKNPLDINMNGMLSSSLAKDKRVGNFFVGAKFTVLFQMNKEKQKKKPEPKPQRTPPPPRAPRPVPPTFYGKIVDAETNQDMEVELIIKKMPEDRQVFKGMANKRTGLITRRLPGTGEYELTASKEGYLNYVETIEMTKSDTIIIALEKIPEPEAPVILHDLLFELNSAVIHPSSEATLVYLYELMNKNPQLNIEITGHTDNTGQAAYNQTLSENRAKAVYEDLIRRGIDPGRLTYSGKGANQPIATNETEEGRATNRRVEFSIK